MSGWFRVKHSWIIGAAVLQSACSLLIKVDDGLDEEVDVGHSQGGSSSQSGPADGGVTEAGASGSGGTGAIGVGGSGAGGSGTVVAGGAGPVAGSAGSESTAGTGAGDAGAVAPPVFDLAFIEDRQESEATLRLVSSELVLSSSSDEEDPAWRISLRPADQVGDVLDFAWSPDGERIAVRFEGLRGPRIAFFEAPDWHELERAEAAALGEPSELDATSNYRWAPSSDALALELSGAEQPLLSGYVIAEARAFGFEPLAFSERIETMDWRSAVSLYLIEAAGDAPVLRELHLTPERQLEAGEPGSDLGLFFPIDLRHVPGGVLAGSDDPFNFLFFWPESPNQGNETAYLPAAYLSNDESFVAEFDDATESFLYPLADQSTPVDTLTGCATVVAWAAGPDRRSLAGSKIACLPPQGEPAVLSIHVYDAQGARTTLTLDDETLRADLATAESWEGHARGFSPGARFLALASAAHDVLIDLRGVSPLLRISDAAGPGSTARGFSPDGEFMLRQRGRNVDVVALSAPPEMRAFDLAPALVDMPPCELAHHSANWCGARSAARRASARWSFSRDVAAQLTSAEGLMVIGASTDPVSVTSESVSTCGASCVGQYEFGR